MAKVKIGTIADLEVYANGDSPFFVWIEKIKDGSQKDPRVIPLHPAEATILAEFLLTASRTPVESNYHNPERTRHLARLIATNKDSSKKA